MATKQARDIDRIDASQDYECRYWSQRFKVTPEKLKRVVSKVGVRVDDVARELDRT